MSWWQGRTTLGYLALTILATALFAVFIVRNLTRTLIGEGDVTSHSYQAYYVDKHIVWKPWPQLHLNNNDLFYPYGVDQVFQPWVFERDLFGALCHHLFGLGPWLQWHYLFSVWIVAVAGYFLLRTAHPPRRAALTAFFLAFGNFYSINKFPGHANLTVVHWTVLGLVVDYLISRKYYLREGFSARMVLLRLVLVLLTIGQDLGYNAGLGLTSLVVTVVWIFLLAAIRTRTIQDGVWRVFGNPPKDWLELRLRVRPRGFWGLLDRSAWQRAFALPAETGKWMGRLQWIVLFIAGGSALFLYFPLVLQIFLHARAFPVTEMQLPGTGVAEHPLRFLIPLLPWTQSGAWQDCLDLKLGGSQEAHFAAEPGLAVVLLAVTGLVVAWRQRLFGAFVPTLVCLLLVLFYDPSHKWNTLCIFPWARFARSGGHLSGIFGPAVGLLTLGIPSEWLRRPTGRSRTLAVWLVGLPLGVLLSAETVTAYQLILRSKWPDPAPNPNFYRLMTEVRQTPNHAVLDWPFCVAGGNGFGTSDLGPYYNKQSNVYCLGEFHGKKTVSGYFGRLHPLQYQSFLEAGWGQMFFSDAPSSAVMEGHRQRRNFRANEWRFFEEFFKLNDFAGILLYTDLLPLDTVNEMHRRFGNPVGVTEYSDAGRVEFIHRPAAWVHLVDERAGRALKLGPPDYTPGTRIDCTAPDALGFLHHGWSYSPPGEPRWSDGHQAEVLFSLAKSESMDLQFEASAYESQHLYVSINGQPLQPTILLGDLSREYHLSVPMGALHVGSNQILFELPNAHSPHDTNGSEDYRTLGILIRWLELGPTGDPVL